MAHTVGMILMLVGISMVLVGWALFRKPGVAFWTLAPVWKANVYLKPPGAVMWVLGSLVGFAGIFVYYFGASA